MLMCDYCQQELKSRGERLFIGYQRFTLEESEERDIPCAWCDEYGDLWEIKFIKEN